MRVIPTEPRRLGLDAHTALISVAKLRSLGLRAGERGWLSSSQVAICLKLYPESSLIGDNLLGHSWLVEQTAGGIWELSAAVPSASGLVLNVVETRGHKLESSIESLASSEAAAIPITSIVDDASTMGVDRRSFYELKSIVELSLCEEAPRHTRCRGVLLCGARGVGKTHMLRLLQAQHEARGGVGVWLEGENVTVDAIRKCLALARTRTRTGTLVIVDNAQWIVLKDVIAELSGFPWGDGLVIVGATREMAAISSGLRDILHHIIALPTPSDTERAELLNVMLDGPGDDSVAGPAGPEWEEVVSRMAGFVASDVQRLVREAVLLAWRDKAEEKGSQAVGPRLLLEALRFVRPSQLQGSSVASRAVSSRTAWEKIGGLDDVKARLLQLVEWRWGRDGSREAMARLGVPGTRGVLLTGPSGVGKTMLAEALGGFTHSNFLSIKTPELFSKYLGDTEAAVRAMFQRATSAAPCILFLDELDALAARRDLTAAGGESGVGERVLATLLNELDGIEAAGDICVLAACSRVDAVDPALLRPGRIDVTLEVPLPDQPGRCDILRRSVAAVRPGEMIDFDEIAARTEGWTGAMLVSLCRDAAMGAIREDLSAASLQQRHFTDMLR